MADEETRVPFGALRGPCRDCGGLNGCYIIRAGQRVVYCHDCGKAQRYNASKDEVGESSMTMPLDFTLYRLRDSAGTLLYVGITNDWPTRMKQHSRSQPWWASVSATDFVHMSCSRQQAEALEKAVIREEHPLYNKVHNVSRPTTSGLEQGESLLDRIAKHFPVNSDSRYCVGDEVALRVDRDGLGVGRIISLHSDFPNQYLVEFATDVQNRCHEELQAAGETPW